MPWEYLAACRGDADPDAWFSDDPQRRAYALRLCSGCPVRVECDTAGRSLEAPYGIWGGVVAGRDVGSRSHRSVSGAA